MNRQIIHSAVIASCLLSVAPALADQPSAQEAMTPTASLYMSGLPYGSSSDGQYVESGSYSNGAPIYQRISNGTTWSLYQRSDSKWYVDFNAVSEDWDGTIAYTNQAQSFPWSGAWSSAAAFRAGAVAVYGAAYANINNGDYVYSGAVYNDKPVYTHAGGGYTWSLYQRSNGHWYLDFDAVSEAWDGTVAYTASACDTPSECDWGTTLDFVTETKVVNIQGAAYSNMTNGYYTFSGTTYNEKPVYTHAGGGYTWSLYQRANGRWYLDFDALSEQWSGTVEESNNTCDFPWECNWDGDLSILFRDTIVTMNDVAYAYLGAAGDYEFAGYLYNNAPVYERTVSGSVWSLYQRADGKWYLDFNSVSEAWDGTVNYTTSAADWPWLATWNNGAAASSVFE